MSWKLKSASDTDKVWAHHARGEETGRYRYEFADGRVLEVGPDGLTEDSPKRRSPRTNRLIAVAVVPSVVLAADLLWQALR